MQSVQKSNNSLSQRKNPHAKTWGFFVYNGMQNFEEFLESKAKESGDTQRHKAQVELAEALRSVFKKYSVTTCREAWDKLTSKKGDEQVRRLINNQSISMSAFHVL